MTQVDSTIAAQMGQERGWRVLTEFPLTGIADGELQAVARVVAAVQSLKLPPASLKRLKTSVASSARRVKSRGPADFSLRLLVYEGTAPQGAAPGDPLFSPDALIAGPAWGCFSVEKTEPSSQWVVIVYLYPEENAGR